MKNNSGLIEFKYTIIIIIIIIIMIIIIMTTKKRLLKEYFSLLLGLLDRIDEIILLVGRCDTVVVVVVGVLAAGVGTQGDCLPDLVGF